MKMIEWQTDYDAAIRSVLKVRVWKCVIFFQDHRYFGPTRLFYYKGPYGTRYIYLRYKFRWVRNAYKVLTKFKKQKEP